jgi:hypothetical protein
MAEKLDRCPNCGLVFNDYEYEFQECETCTWPRCDIEEKGEPYVNQDWWDGFVVIDRI